MVMLMALVYYGKRKRSETSKGNRHAKGSAEEARHLLPEPSSWGVTQDELIPQQ